MNLKLAEYKDGKFERFLKLGEDFLLGGDEIVVHTEFPDGIDWKDPNLACQMYLREKGEESNLIKALCGYASTVAGESGFGKYCFSIFTKDFKDPLNRFNGLFDGRTYGEGRFILSEYKVIDRFGKRITMSQDDVFSYNEYFQKACDFINFHHWQETEDEVETNSQFRILGNLHENPELYEKIE